MDTTDPATISMITERIKTLEPENASKIIDYFMSQEIAELRLIRMAFGPNALIEEFCREAKYELGLLPRGSSLNRDARPFYFHDRPLPPSSTRNEFLDFSRNPNNAALHPSLIRYNPNFNSSPFHDGSSQQRQQLSLFATDAYQFPPGGFGSPTQQRMIAAQSVGDFGSQMSNRQGSGRFGVEGGLRSPSEQQSMIAAKSVADFGSPMSNRQGSGQFGQGYCYSPGSHEREDLVSKTIFLAFQPTSSFTNEDVSTYFSKFGAVEDVDIPYQQKRMFGFVTFANDQTVGRILARQNPHLISDSWVTVKPYKGKEKREKQQQQVHQLLEGGNCSPSSSPSGLDDSRELYNCRIGPRKTREMLRRKTEQADVQLPDMENLSIHRHQHSPSTGSPAHLLSQVMEGDSDRGEQVETNNEETSLV
ncbi:PREDICTED: zinc finger CCCH domain-containing protein 46-like [Camelina sativa]|uniref:Zinc finger CCCH domain-containing protein 46-like n=1 Tax=Camelina sativa TaxID=90675 RepID=A0ABM0X5P4_CAMSA|nr:PREDICTED: zinc finger CCCH domain-containing protein 46-like [Camelina sativa]